LLRHAFVEVPAVSVVKIEMLEKKCFSTQQWVYGYVFIGDKLYDKNLYLKRIPST
jgi:hypothetical protein